MNSISFAIGNFFLSQWIWSITWGLYHLPISQFIMFCLIKRYAHLRITPAFLLSIFSPVASLCLLNLITILCVVYGLGIEYTCPDMAPPLYTHLFFVSFALGAFYTLFHALLCSALNRLYPINVSRITRLGGMAHMISALIMYFLSSWWYL